jgi:hypothetical protein
MAVHDVDVNPVGARPLGLAHIFAEPGKIRRED